MKAAAAGPRNCTDDPDRKSTSCGSVRNGQNTGSYWTAWPGAAPERDLTSNSAEDEELRCNGNGLGGCAGWSRWGEIHERGRCHSLVDPWSLCLHDGDDADAMSEALTGNSTCRTGWCYLSPNAHGISWVH